MALNNEDKTGKLSNEAKENNGNDASSKQPESKKPVKKVASSLKKKKKKIIIVTGGNDTSSKSQRSSSSYTSGQKSGYSQRGGQKNANRSSRGTGSVASGSYHPIKPKTAPSQMAGDYHRTIPHSEQPSHKQEESRVDQNELLSSEEKGKKEEAGQEHIHEENVTSSEQVSPAKESHEENVTPSDRGKPSQNMAKDKEARAESKEGAGQVVNSVDQTAAEQTENTAVPNTVVPDSANADTAKEAATTESGSTEPNRAYEEKQEEKKSSATAAERGTKHTENLTRGSSQDNASRKEGGSTSRSNAGRDNSRRRQQGNTSGQGEVKTQKRRDDKQGRSSKNSGGNRYGSSQNLNGRGTNKGENRGENRGDARRDKGDARRRGSYGDSSQGRSRGQGNRSRGRGSFDDAGEQEFSRSSSKRRNAGNAARDRRKKDFAYEQEEQKERKNRSGRFVRPVVEKVEEPKDEIKVITIPEKLTIGALAEAMHMKASDLIKKLFLEGKAMTVNSEVKYEEAEDIAAEYDILCEKEEKVDAIQELLKEDEDPEESMVSRPPVICVMGHVDHGKTSILDYIRHSRLAEKEAGGITQAIGAYTVDVNGRSITFLDTPGHEAFTAMRLRGAMSTDIAVLVVAADDGVMPQTIEAINHARAAGIEIIVAINKIDKPEANPDRVKEQLSKYNLIPTDWGGQTEFVCVSAKTGEGIEDLLETILLEADVMELRANPNRLARGLVLEAKLDRGRGPVANVLVQKGTLHVGDFISAGPAYGKVRAMINDKGVNVKEAKPSDPVMVLGLSDVPSAGEVIVAHPSNEEAKMYAQTYKEQHKEELVEENVMSMNVEDLFDQMREGKMKELDLIVKADVQGSVEALNASLLKLSNDEVKVRIIHSAPGAITESDVDLAAASNAAIIGFNVQPNAIAKANAERNGVSIHLYRIIYQAIDDVDAALKGMLAPVYEEKVIGHAEVRQLFKSGKVGNIAGCMVLDGTIERNAQVRVTRGEDKLFEGELSSLKRYQDDVKEVKAGFDCGIVFRGFSAMEVGDQIEAFKMVEVPREEVIARKEKEAAKKEKESANKKDR